MPELIKNYCLSQYPDIKWKFFYENPILDSAGGIINALPFFDDQPFLCINADIYWQPIVSGKNLLISLYKTLGNSNDVAVLLKNVAEIPKPLWVPANFSLHKDNLNWLENNEELSQREGASLVYTGVQVLHPRLFINQVVRPLPMRTFLQSAQKNQKLAYLITPGFWADYGDMEKLNFLRKQKNLAI